MPSPSSYIERLADLAATGRPLVSVTMVEAIGSTPQDAGSKMLVTARGLQYGTIGGGRVEAQAIQHAKNLLADAASNGKTAELVQWNLQNDVGMTCGGVVKLYFEAYNHRQWQIVIFGAGHVAAAVVHCLLPLECCITCIDPREEWLARIPDHPRLEKICTDDMAAVVPTISPDAYILCMTMGHRSDRPVLEEIFRRGLTFPYLGVIGSAAKRAVLRRELAAAGASPEQIDSFRCPIGIPVGRSLPAEIAISVAAQLLEVRDALAAAT